MTLLPRQNTIGSQSRKSLSNFSSLVCLAAVTAICLMVSCKKDNPAPKLGPPINNRPDTVHTAGTPDFRDSLTDYAAYFYLWYKSIPANFKPHTYSLTDTLKQLITAIQGFSPLNAANGKHYDHFSFVLTEADYQHLFVQGVSLGFGLEYKFDRTGKLRISYAAHASPAFSQGVRRGWQIVSVNGVTAATDQATINKLNTALGATTVNFVFFNPASSKQVSITLNQTSVADDEVIATNVFPIGSKTVGYMAYNTFLTQTNNGEITHPGLDSAFTHFASAKVTDLVVDLRYNGGGYTDVAAQLDNAVIPAANNGKVLYTQRWNDTLNYFYKHGYKGTPHDTTFNVNKSDSHNPAGLNINSITFIVSYQTYSAAELVINNLYPYLPVKLIGVGYGRTPERQNTGGKPFGFFNWAMPRKNPVYEAFLINFETTNALGKDDYVSGFVPDLQTYDGVEFDWGNPNEDPLKAALAYYSTGLLSRPADPPVSLSNDERIKSSSNSFALSLNENIPSHRFVGMLNQRTGIPSRNASLEKFLSIKVRKDKPVEAKVH